MTPSTTAASTRSS
ncbi:hypothetical protein LINGRAHAP2_LOCUS13908 [Linum grandiflorum]